MPGIPKPPKPPKAPKPHAPKAPKPRQSARDFVRNSYHKHPRAMHKLR